MKEEGDLKECTKRFALRIIRLFMSLPKTNRRSYQAERNHTLANGPEEIGTL
jgi:hypothetical protein